MTNTLNPQTISRRPHVGDLVLHYNSGRVYLVERVHSTPGGGRVDFYQVVDVETQGRPNTFNPGEVATLSAAAAQKFQA
jgi:hypothetical protein